MLLRLSHTLFTVLTGYAHCHFPGAIRLCVQYRRSNRTASLVHKCPNVCTRKTSYIFAKVSSLATMWAFPGCASLFVQCRPERNILRNSTTSVLKAYALQFTACTNAWIWVIWQTLASRNSVVLFRQILVPRNAGIWVSHGSRFLITVHPHRANGM